MTFRFFRRTFDGMFVVGGDTEASVVAELFTTRKRCFKYPVGLVQSESGNVLRLFDDFFETHCQPNLNSDVRRQSVLVIRPDCGVGNHMYGRSRKAL